MGNRYDLLKPYKTYRNVTGAVKAQWNWCESICMTLEDHANLLNLAGHVKANFNVEIQQFLLEGMYLNSGYLAGLMDALQLLLVCVCLQFISVLY